MTGELNEVGIQASAADAGDLAGAAGGTASVPVADPAPDTAPQPAPTPSSKRAGVGRVVHVYSDQWDGPRPGDVVFAGEGERPSYTANVKLDGHRDQAVLAEFRQLRSGNSIPNLTLYEPLSAERRVQALSLAPEWGTFRGRFIAEWPPVV